MIRSVFVADPKPAQINHFWASSIQQQKFSKARATESVTGMALEVVGITWCPKQINKIELKTDTATCSNYSMEKRKKHTQKHHTFLIIKICNKNCHVFADMHPHRKPWYINLFSSSTHKSVKKKYQFPFTDFLLCQW